MGGGGGEWGGGGSEPAREEKAEGVGEDAQRLGEQHRHVGQHLKGYCGCACVRVCVCVCVVVVVVCVGGFAGWVGGAGKVCGEQPGRRTCRSLPYSTSEVAVSAGTPPPLPPRWRRSIAMTAS